MSLITRCPACGTMFKVVPDQLRVSDGWVRCGHCTQVFDAAGNMQDDEPAEVGLGAAPAAPAPAPADALEPAAGLVPVMAQGQPSEAEPRQPEHDSPEPDLPEPREPEHAPATFFPLIHAALPEDAADALPDPGHPRTPADLPSEPPLDPPFALRRLDRQDEPADAPIVRQPAPLEPEPELEPELEEVSFVREARRREFWETPVVRATLSALAVVLAALLVVQFAIHNRDRLAASDPGLQPWLAGLCVPFGCTIRPPRHIESISIDNSSFNNLGSDTYRLDVTVKNQAATQSAIPALELTLTDAQDQPIIRRVLLPAEIAPGKAVIAPGGDWSTSIALGVTADAVTSRIAGYRVIAFYP